MEIFQYLLILLTGCGVFIAGMNMLSGGLEKTTGPGLKKLLGKISNNRFPASASDCWLPLWCRVLRRQRS